MRNFLFSVGLMMSLGLTLPSCPGTDALQTQLDESKSRQAELEKLVTQLTSETKRLNDDHNETKKLLLDLANSVSTLKTDLGDHTKRLETLEGAITKLEKAPMPSKAQSYPARTGSQPSRSGQQNKRFR
jgi:chromosome segregation ATPase